MNGETVSLHEGQNECVLCMQCGTREEGDVRGRQNADEEEWRAGAHKFKGTRTRGQGGGGSPCGASPRARYRARGRSGGFSSRCRGESLRNASASEHYGTLVTAGIGLGRIEAVGGGEVRRWTRIYFWTIETECAKGMVLLGLGGITAGSVAPPCAQRGFWSSLGVSLVARRPPRAVVGLMWAAHHSRAISSRSPRAPKKTPRDPRSPGL